MHTDGKSGVPGNAQSNEDIRSGGKNGAEGGKAAVKAASGRRRVRPYCIAMALAALIVLVLPAFLLPYLKKDPFPCILHILFQDLPLPYTILLLTFPDKTASYSFLLYHSSFSFNQ